MKSENCSKVNLCTVTGLLHLSFLAFDLRNALITKLKSDHMLLYPISYVQIAFIEKIISVLEFGPEMN